MHLLEYESASDGPEWAACKCRVCRGYDSDLDEFYDYGKYGRRCMEQNQGMFTNQGYISYHGTLTMEELMTEDPAEQYRKEQEEIAGMEMG